MWITDLEGRSLGSRDLLRIRRPQTVPGADFSADIIVVSICLAGVWCCGRVLGKLGGLQYPPAFYMMVFISLLNDPSLIELERLWSEQFSCVFFNKMPNNAMWCVMVCVQCKDCFCWTQLITLTVFAPPVAGCFSDVPDIVMVQAVCSKKNLPTKFFLLLILPWEDLSVTLNSLG